MIDFTQLYDKHIDNLFAFGSRFTADREMIKDCIQDVFVKMYTKKDTLDKINNLDSYLYVALRNRINDEFRRNVHMCDNAITDVSMRRVAEEERHNRERMERELMLTTTVEDAISKLSPRQQQVICLYYIERKKYNDICRIMGINYQSVRNLMCRSITRLRSFVGETELAM